MKRLFLIAIVMAGLGASASAGEPAAVWQEPLLDDCLATDNHSSIGTEWTPVLDSDRGGTSSIEWSSTEGTFSVTGGIEPVPGSLGPGTAGMLLPLGPAGEEFDVSDWDGIRITIRRSGAPLLLRVVSTEILNEDHFAVMIPEVDEFETFEYNFRELGQVMSAQQPWTGRNITGIELVTFGWVPDEFSWELRELAFFKTDQQDSILAR